MADYVDDTRRSYDAMAEDYAAWIRAELAAKPFDRDTLDTFADLVRGAGSVADIGCGSGRVTAYLNERGVPAFGIDLSPRMVEVATRDHPGLRFTEGSMTALAEEAGTLAGVVAWYSTIHVPDEDLPGVFAEFHRVLAPGGHLQLAFQAGAHVTHRTDAYADDTEHHDIALDFHHRQPTDIAALLAAAGFEVVAHAVRDPDTDGPYPEDTPQAYVLARKLR